MDLFRGTEKRKNQRLVVTYQISYKLKDSQDPYNLSRTKNIGRGGMLLLASKAYARGAWLVLLVRCPFSTQPIEAAGEVLESREVVKNSVYEMRLRFSPVSRERLSALDEFIKKRVKQEPMKGMR